MELNQDQASESSSIASEHFHDCKDSSEGDQLPSEPPVLQSIEDSLASKEEATALFKAGSLPEAIEKYELALMQSPEEEREHRAKLNFNIGMCILKDCDSAPKPTG